MKAFFEEEGNFDYPEGGGGGGDGGLPGGDDEGVDEGFEPEALGIVGEDEGGEGRAVDLAVGGEDGVAPAGVAGGEDLGVGEGVGAHEFVRIEAVTACGFE